MTQMQLIEKHFTSGMTITSKEAFELYGVTRLSAKVFDLRAKGYDIVTDFKEGHDRWGNKVRFAVYHLKK